MKKTATSAKHSEDEVPQLPKIDAGFFANAIQVNNPEELWHATGAGVRKQQITLRVDSDVIEFFRRRGKGYQRLMNFALRVYMLRQQSAAESSKLAVRRKKRTS
ncbi:MAG TPA: BrnA antitoxin family protein [Candidatus Angelobacter sp.]